MGDNQSSARNGSWWAWATLRLVLLKMYEVGGEKAQGRTMNWASGALVRVGTVQRLKADIAATCQCLPIPKFLTCGLGLAGVGSLHAIVAQNLQQLEAEGRDVLLEFVDVVLGDALAFLRTSLFVHYVAPDQVMHHRLWKTPNQVWIKISPLLLYDR